MPHAFPRRALASQARVTDSKYWFREDGSSSRVKVQYALSYRLYVVKHECSWVNALKYKYIEHSFSYALVWSSITLNVHTPLLIFVFGISHGTSFQHRCRKVKTILSFRGHSSFERKFLSTRFLWLIDHNCHSMSFNQGSLSHSACVAENDKLGRWACHLQATEISMQHDCKTQGHCMSTCKRAATTGIVCHFRKWEKWKMRTRTPHPPTLMLCGCTTALWRSLYLFVLVSFQKLTLNQRSFNQLSTRHSCSFTLLVNTLAC